MVIDPFYLLDCLTVATYSILVLGALIIPLVPLLKWLVYHGKTRQRSASTVSTVTRSKNDFVDVLLNEMVVPKRYFTHFYAVGLLSLLIWRGHARLQHRTKWPLTIVEVLLLFHLSRRFVECLVVHQWRPGSHMHLAVYIVGIAHYLWLPFVFFPYDSSDRINDDDARTTTAWASISVRDAMFSRNFALVAFSLWAQLQQLRHHVILANLRQPPSDTTMMLRTRTNSSGPVLYGLPQGGWFQYVSCPHYTAEILVYLSLITSQWSTFPSDKCQFRMGILLLWVVSNLVVNGLQSHHWYLNNIPSYSRLHRRAIIPFLV